LLISGLAVPKPVLRVLQRDETFNQNIVLNSVVTVVDAKNFLGQLNDDRKKDTNVKNEALEQVNSDLISSDNSRLLWPIKLSSSEK
jgi:G3E family GTPase